MGEGTTTLGMIALALAAMPQPVGPLRSDLTSLPSVVDLSASTGARLALTVDPAGVPRRCDVVAASAAPRLDRVGCALLLRTARFHPAVDEDGAAVAAVVEQAVAVNGGTPRGHDIDFALPVSRGVPPGGAVAEARVVTAPDGRVASCALAAGTGAPALDRLVCPGIAAAVLPPARGGDGTPLRAMRLVSVGFATGEIARRTD